jgi:hypothetical protein
MARDRDVDSRMNSLPLSPFSRLRGRSWRCAMPLPGRWHLSLLLINLGHATDTRTPWPRAPTYTFVMSCFELPLATCEKLKMLVANRWRGVENGKKKMHWRSWAWLSTPKSLGGMGFRDFALFNQAMLAKQGWRLLTVPNSLRTRVLKGRYHPDTDFLHAARPRSASYTWRSMLHGRDLLVQGIRWSIGDGNIVKF